MKNYIIGVIMSFAIIITPSLAQAQAASLTSTQISAIIQLLQSFGADQSVINSVQITLNGGTPTNGAKSFCHNFNRDLTIGRIGGDVVALNQALSASGIDITGNTSQPKIQPAGLLSRTITVNVPGAGDIWHEGNAYSISWSSVSGDFDTYEVLLSNRLVPGVKGGGPIYNSVANGKNTYVTFSSSDLSPNIVRTWLANSKTDYLVTGPVSEQDLRRNFYYTIQAVKNIEYGKQMVIASGTSGIFSILPVASNTQPSISVTYPTAGMTFTQGQSITVSWEAVNGNGNYTLSYNTPSGSGGGDTYTAAQAHCDAASKCYVSWTPTFSSSYVKIGIYDTVSGRSGKSESFVITLPSCQDGYVQSDRGCVPTPPSSTLTASPSTITAGQPVTISYSASNSSYCVASGGWTGTYNAPTGYYAGWGGDKGPFYPTQTTTYSFTCYSSNGSFQTQSTMVTVTAPQSSITITSSLRIPHNTPVVISGTAIPSPGALNINFSSIQRYGGAGVSTNGTWTVNFGTMPVGSYPFVISDASGRNLANGTVVVDVPAAPAITSLSPASGRANTEVIIDGTNLISSSNGVLFNGALISTQSRITDIDGREHIRFIVPTNASPGVYTVGVVHTIYNLTSNLLQFTVVP